MTPDKPQFPTISADEAHQRQSLLGALCGVQMGEGVLRASIPPCSTDGEAAWLHCAEDLAFRIVRLDDRPIRIDPAEGPAIATLLDAADLLLSAIEAALGLELEPTDIGPRPDRATLVARVETGEGEARIDLALPPDAALLPTPAPFAPLLLGHIPVPLRIILEGPRLSPVDAATLAPGDLLLLGPAMPEARFRLADGTMVQGRIAPTERLFRPIPHRDDALTASPLP
ncbi:hypothetical protein MOK15_21430 [Sphingobium sp. BYY-5]|uniref:hypothetical protein n=1 Tax=Sphingobium sp. BYY-5 TaxID=2926400 RepID=UPI001FA763AC|nr:hypothetical protein [Sphingobium sp. BYY-5]MCI4592622.1 hypothetical protein [Sphingobium sp. BYY-5]